MATQNAEATWEGSLREGKGSMKLGSGYEGPFTFASRFETADGTNPEELIGAALAGCFSMALSAGLGRAEFNPTKIHTTAKVHLERINEQLTINKIELSTTAEIPDIDEDTFMDHVTTAKDTCIVSRALAGVNEITIEATLNS
ncbi:MAG: OsmC family peroxiredoxin [Chloroflexi bacterium]|nr:OsmC family peroxiredoxin [Chloroflexota bacterium]